MRYLLLVFMLLFIGCRDNTNVENLEVNKVFYKIKKKGSFNLTDDYQFSRLQAISVAKDNLVNFLVKKLNFLTKKDLEKVKDFIYIHSNIEKVYKFKNKVFAIAYIDKNLLKKYILNLDKKYETKLNEVIR